MKRCLTVILLLAAAAGAWAASWSETFRFSTGTIDISTVTRDGETYTLVNPGRRPTPGFYVTQPAEPGSPLLPAWSFTVVIPQGMKVGGIDVSSAGIEQVPIDFKVFPAQVPVPVSRPELPAFVPGSPAVYGSDEPSPGAYATVSPVGVKSGFRLVTVTLNPVQYFPRSGRLVLATELAVTLRYEPDPLAARERLTRAQIETFGGAVRELVLNPGDVARYAPAERPTDFGSIDCIVITSAALQPSFAPLVAWRTKTGFKTEVRTVAWITSSYPGRDDPEKIRNFIRDYYTNQGTRFVVLGGDYTVVPPRLARAIVNTSPPEVGNIACDLYYGDIQWSWDGNNNNIFGEGSYDTVDLYSDLYVGRASVETSTEVQTFVNKVITHEQNPPTDYLRRILLVDALLWTIHDQTQSNDSIMAYIPPGWSTVHISNPGNMTMIRDSLNHGFQLCHMVGHGNEVGIYNGGMAFYGNSVISGHTNGSRVGFINSIACYPGCFDYAVSDCLAELSHNCSTGGALALAFNSRFGWGTPPGPGPSEMLDIRFYEYFFSRDTLPLGMIHALSKEAYRNTAMASQVYRWCYYELNLFGDPLQKMYKNVPAQLTASFSSPIAVGSQLFPVTVTSGGSNVGGALVCLWKGTEVYDRNYTNASGQVSFTINPTSGGQMYVTATRPGYLPDADSCEVTSGVTDVGVARIVTPTGTLDSGAVVTPAAWIRNFGALSASFPVMFRIGGSYLSTRSVTALPAGDSVQVFFDAWTASQRGSFQARCSTYYSADPNRSNDTLSTTVTVRVIDAQALSIVAPAGMFDSGTVVTPQARVRNLGTAAATFSVTMRIGSAYTSTQNVAGLNPGESTLVSFANWTASPCGALAVRCTVALAGDMVPNNNLLTGVVTVGLVDVALARLIAPSGTLDSQQLLTPACSVMNYSITSQTYGVRMRIGGFYNRVVTVTGHAPGARLLVQFPAYSAWPRGPHSVTACTELAGDQVSANDTATGTIMVLVRDVACARLVAPFGTYDSGTAVTPSCSLDNFGSNVAGYSVRMKIGTVYNRTVTVTNHVPGTRIGVAFPAWIASPKSNFLVSCSTELYLDCRAANNRLATMATVREPATRDVSCTHILAPAGMIDSGAPITPSCSVRNYGQFSETYTVRMRLGSGYNEAVTVTGHMPGTSRSVDFPEWRAWPVGAIAVTCSTELGVDRVPGNDGRAGSVLVLRAGPDIACTRIVEPEGTYSLGYIVAPSCSLYNYGNTTASYTVHMKVDTLYDSTAQVTGHQPGTAVSVYFPIWTAGPPGGHAAAAFATLAGDLVPGNDTAVAACAVLPPVVQPWTEDEPLPGMPSDRAVKDGAWLSYGSGTGLVYAAKGNKSNDFYSYNPRSRTWLILNALPMGDGKFASKGARGVSDGNRYVYAAKGNNTREFYRYDVATDSWARRTDVPLGSTGKAIKGGTDMAFVPPNYVYLLKGYKNEFWRYDATADSWQSLPDAAPLKWNNGSWLVYDGAAKLYAHKAKYHEFRTFDLLSQTWDTAPYPTGMPFLNSQFRSKKSKDGGCADRYLGGIYALKGGNTQEFWRYDIARDSWAELETMPAYGSTGRPRKVKNGGDITSDGNGLFFAFKGNKTNEFWKYTVLPTEPTMSRHREGVLAQSTGNLTTAFRIAPNPLRAGFATITISGQVLKRSNGPVVLTVYDASGRLVRHWSLGISNPSTALDLRAMPAGVYVVTVQSAGTRATGKLVVH